ncbi:hypothetical protein FF38_02996 [Lucilia cuprina]|uniref:Uncharacterized protein n=1 Tax=Lucilia cuprina TaxID=7375 RepID=A0A0L0BY07_LUCCU|nr:hypothetical protein FF38_02996 [Lucilia cuprina]
MKLIYIKCLMVVIYSGGYDFSTLDTKCANLMAATVYRCNFRNLITGSQNPLRTKIYIQKYTKYAPTATGSRFLETEFVCGPKMKDPDIPDENKNLVRYIHSQFLYPPPKKIVYIDFAISFVTHPNIDPRSTKIYILGKVSLILKKTKNFNAHYCLQNTSIVLKFDAIRKL